MLVDSHCHLNRLDYDLHGDIHTILERARKKQIEKFLCIATSLESFAEISLMAEQHSDVFCTAGVHPLQKNQDDIDYELLLEQGSHSKVVAIGETGLDYYYSADNASWQKKALISQIKAAKELSKPLIIHSRDAREDTLEILAEEKADQVGGILHCFTESYDMAKKAIDMGFYISFSGIVTFKTADSLRDVARKLPLDRILVETDCPWLAPVPYRGKENQPAYTVEVAKHLAEVLSISYEALCNQTTENFYNLFPLCKK